MSCLRSPFALPPLFDTSPRRIATHHHRYDTHLAPRHRSQKAAIVQEEQARQEALQSARRQSRDEATLRLARERQARASVCNGCNVYASREGEAGAGLRV